MSLKRFVIIGIICLSVLNVVGVFVLIGLVSAQEEFPNNEIPFSTPRVPVYLPTYQPNTPPVTDIVFEQVPGPDVPTLQELALGTNDDTQIIHNVVNYYDQHRDELQVLWREDNDTRLAGLYAMYIVHISHIYGETTYPETLQEYMTQERSHCGVYSLAQHQITEALGLTWRFVELTSGWHGWIEVLVDGQWETFDATVNVWINRSGFELIDGAVREYRYFYTPLLDIDRPDARLHLNEGYNMQNLRDWMPGLGLFYNPPGELFISDRFES